MLKPLSWLVLCVLLVLPVSAAAQTTSTLTFTASADHAVVAQGQPVVTSYELTLVPQTGAPLAPFALNKPTPDAQNVITVNITTYLNSVPPGNYTATVRAIGSWGSAVSPPSPSFTLAGPAPAAPGIPGIQRSGG